MSKRQLVCYYVTKFCVRSSSKTSVITSKGKFTCRLYRLGLRADEILVEIEPKIKEGGS